MSDKDIREIITRKAVLAQRRRNPDRLDSLQDALDRMARNTDAIWHIRWWMREVAALVAALLLHGKASISFTSNARRYSSSAQNP